MKKLFYNIGESFKLIYYLFSSKTIFIRRFSNGMGDNLLLTGLLPEVRKKYPNHKIIIESEKWCELFDHNPFVDWVTSKHFKTTKRHFKPKYFITEKIQDSIYKQIGKRLNLDGKFYPQLFLTSNEKESVQHIFIKNNKPSIVFCPFGKRGFSANRKEWGSHNFQTSINLTKDNFNWYQIGIPKDELMKNAIDARELSIRKSAALIQQSDIFFGLEGGLMHLAKSVETPAIIIYGGVIHPRVSAYENNLNLYNEVDCSPCFRSDKPLEDCTNMKCMRKFTPEFVKEKIEKFLEEKL